MISRKTLALAASSALAILAAAGGALGDSNRAVVNQAGKDNSANVIQSGEFNVIGTVKWGTGANIGNYDAYQNGDHNTLTITQSGNGNGVGTANSHVYGAGYGSWDYAPDPDVLVYPLEQRQIPAGQRSLRNAGLDQIGNYNELTITQVEGSSYNNGNIVGAVWQEGSTTATGITNQLTIVQDNGNGTGDAGSPYPANYPSDQAYNVVGDIHQENTGSGGAGSENIILIGQHTNHTDAYARNNRMDIITQIGADNDLTLNQLGIGNIVNRIEQSGAGGGFDNAISIQQRLGNFNWVGTVLQNGQRHEASITQAGTNNQVGLVQQFGTRNEANVTQSGTGNIIVSLYQDNAGAASSFGNEATLSFHGDDNGVGSVFGGAASSVGLGVATVSQLGDNNLLTYDVTSDGNLFAFSQDGSGNTITGSTSGGDVNQVAIKQVGNSNGAHFTQIGGGNNLAIVQ